LLIVVRDFRKLSYNRSPGFEVRFRKTEAFVTHFRHPAWILGIATFVVANGCKKSSSSSAGSGSETAQQSVAAQQLFNANCAKCHALSGSTPAADGKGRGKGPDLTRVGADSSHTVDWIAEHIRNPKTHKSDSRMPSFEGKLQPSEIRALAEFLAEKKG
jgi:mono/diheme cytochrome c family protein